MKEIASLQVRYGKVVQVKIVCDQQMENMAQL